LLKHQYLLKILQIDFKKLAQISIRDRTRASYKRNTITQKRNNLIYGSAQREKSSNENARRKVDEYGECAEAKRRGNWTC